MPTEVLVPTHLKICEEVLLNILSYEISKATEVPHKLTSMANLLDYIGSLSLRVALTNKGVVEVTNKVIIEDSDNRDFMFRITDKFNAQLNLLKPADTILSNVVEALSTALGESVSAKDNMVLLPEVIYNNIKLDRVGLASLLASNKWLITLCLINTLDLDSAVQTMFTSIEK